MRKFFNIFIVILYLISPTQLYSIEQPVFKNLIIHKKPKILENFEFMTHEGDKVRLNDFNNKILVINFWATWCVPCRDEMPSLDKLSKSKEFDNLIIIPINIGEEKNKAELFFKNTNIENLKIFYDKNSVLAKKLALRGLPTTLLINKKGEEFSRIIGAANFEDKKLSNWLKNYD